MSELMLSLEQIEKEKGISKDDVAGPVGIVKVVDDSYDYYRPYGVLAVIMSMVNITMLLSANLAVMNLLPFPALDGGRILIVLFTWITGKEVSAKVEGIIHAVGLAALLLLAVVVRLHIGSLERANAIGDRIVGHVFVAAEIGTFQGTLRGDDT